MEHPWGCTPRSYILGNAGLGIPSLHHATVLDMLAAAILPNHPTSGLQRKSTTVARTQQGLSVTGKAWSSVRDLWCQTSP